MHKIKVMSMKERLRETSNHNFFCEKYVMQIILLEHPNSRCETLSGMNTSTHRNVFGTQKIQTDGCSLM